LGRKAPSPEKKRGVSEDQREIMYTQTKPALVPNNMLCTPQALKGGPTGWQRYPAQPSLPVQGQYV